MWSSLYSQLDEEGVISTFQYRRNSSQWRWCTYGRPVLLEVSGLQGTLSIPMPCIVSPSSSGRLQVFSERRRISTSEREAEEPRVLTMVPHLFRFKQFPVNSSTTFLSNAKVKQVTKREQRERGNEKKINSS